MMNQLKTKQKVEETSQHPSHNTQHTRGISLISLIITIIVIIILAAIVIFTGLNTPDRANFAKFTQEFSDFRTAITQDYFQKKANYAIQNKTRSDAQIYYEIATKTPVDMNDELNATGSVATLNASLTGIAPEGLTGENYYEIENDGNVAEWKKNSSYYEPRGASGERHFLTDAGEPFILPGYRVQEDGQTKWYVNERKYYVSDEPVKLSQTLILGPGLYDVDTNEQIYSWQKLIDEEIINVVGTELYTCKDGSKINGKLVISDDITAITNGAFYKCNDLKSVQIGKSVTLISNSAFCETGLTEVSIPSNVQEISNAAFGSCNQLKKVKLVNGLKIIKNGAFQNCPQLEEIVVPRSVEEFSGSSFSGSRVSKLVLEEGINVLSLGGVFNVLSCNLYLPKSITRIEGSSMGSLVINYAGTEEEWSHIAIDDNAQDFINNCIINYNIAP